MRHRWHVKNYMKNARFSARCMDCNKKIKEASNDVRDRLTMEAGNCPGDKKKLLREHLERAVL